MDAILYLKCFLISLIGWGLQTALKMRAMQIKAKLTKAEFSPKKYFQEDWLSVAVSILSILIFLFTTDEILHWKPELVEFIKAVYAFIGYASSDIAARIFSVANKRINKALGTEHDTKPTPAEPPIQDTDEQRTLAG